MTDKRDLKRRVRERMERTGESYMTALRHVTGQRETDDESPAVEPIPHIEPIPHVEPIPDVEPIPYIELRDISDIARDFAITCPAVMYPSLSDIEPREALAGLCLLLGKTREDRAFDLFRDILIGGDRPRIRLDYYVEESVNFANRVRAGIGGISNGGHMLAMHVDIAADPVEKTNPGDRPKRLVLFLLQLTPDFISVVREPTLVIAALDDVVGFASLRVGTHVIKLRGGGTNP